MESYKAQIVDLETKHAARASDLDTARFELEQARTKLRITEAERAKDSEALELYQERVRELELVSNRPVPKPKPPVVLDPGAGADDEDTEDAAAAAAARAAVPPSPGLDDELLDQSFGEELDNALSGTTMTDLKLQVRRLERELAAARADSAEAPRVLVLENLLEDAARAKARYEADYLGAHREKLGLAAQLEEIRAGRGARGDGAEAAIALRQRLNETVDELDALKLAHTALEVRHEALQKELTIAKSDRARFFIFVAGVPPTLTPTARSEPREQGPARHPGRAARVGQRGQDGARGGARAAADAATRACGEESTAARTNQRAAARQGRPAERRHWPARAHAAARARHGRTAREHGRGRRARGRARTRARAARGQRAAQGAGARLAGEAVQGAGGMCSLSFLARRAWMC
jgi:hypothetical protein